MMKFWSPLRTVEKVWSIKLCSHKGRVKEQLCLANLLLVYFLLLLCVIIFIIYGLTMASKMIAATFYFWKDIWIKHMSRISILLAEELQHLFHMLWYTDQLPKALDFAGFTTALLEGSSMFLHLEFKNLLSIMKYKPFSPHKPLTISVLCTVVPVCLCIPVTLRHRGIFLSVILSILLLYYFTNNLLPLKGKFFLHSLLLCFLSDPSEWPGVERKPILSSLWWIISV